MKTQLLSGKNIFITGGSRGIGAALVKHCAELGARVAFTFASQESQAQSVLQSLEAVSSLKHACFKMNVNSQEEIDLTIQKTLEMFGEIHGVVNNAGITKDQLLLRMKPDDFQSVLSANLMGPFLVTKALAKNLLRAPNASVVNVSSVIGATGNAGQSNYAASKAGLIGFTKSLALELASRNVRVNAVAPGYIKSDMTNALNEDQLKKIVDKIPLNRAGEPEEVASVVAFLLSDHSSYITGQTLHVNGGMYFN